MYAALHDTQLRSANKYYAKKKKINVQEWLLVSLTAYIGFMWMLLLVAYGQRDPNAFFLNQHIRKSFSSNTTASMSANDVLTWANTTLLKHLFGKYPGKWQLPKYDYLKQGDFCLYMVKLYILDYMVKIHFLLLLPFTKFNSTCPTLQF